ncbi:MAG TPA: peptidase M48, partial [Yinghuangia sp.]|nr:peptidase M48 [Yinghuangia sp.]
AAIMAGDYPRRDEDGDASVRGEAKASADSYRESARQTADPLFGLLRDLADGAVDAGGRLRDKFTGRSPGSGTAEPTPPKSTAKTADESNANSGDANPEQGGPRH